MKKNHKGMTLVEVIVALALFAIMGLVVASIFSASANINKMTNATNNKLDVQIAMANFFGEDTSTIKDDENFTVNFDFITGAGSSIKKINVPIETRELRNTKTESESEDKTSTNIKYFVKSTKPTR